MKLIRFKDYLKDYLEYYNISEKEFALRIGITPKHLIDILSGKVDLSSSTILAISIVTDIPADYIYNLEASYKLEKEIDDYLKQNNITLTQFLNKFNYRYLLENEYIKFTNTTNKVVIATDILKFLRVTKPSKIYEIDEPIFYKSKNDKPELLALWLEKCYRKTLNQQTLSYNKNNIIKIVDFIRKSASKEEFDIPKLTSFFNENGIYLVIEPDIPGSKIRGAFRVHKNKPAIYLTLKHKRIADIYFALLHELAHCKRDFNKAKKNSLVSLDESEEVIDNIAYEWMIPKEYLNNTFCNDYDITKENIYPKSFVVYMQALNQKISYSNKNHQKYNFIIKD